MYEMHEKERKRDHTSEGRITLGRKSNGEDEGVERKVFGREKKVYLLRKIEENEI